MSKLIDLLGQTFDRLTVVERVENKHRKARWRCDCACGGETIVYGTALTAGLVRSCGCLLKEFKEDLMGQTFGRWTVIGEATNAGEATRWLCRCDCGTERIVRACNLRSGKSASCGCLLSEKSRSNAYSITHGYSKHPLYGIFIGIKRRCYDVRRTEYHNYGARGIRVCDAWVNDPAKFIEWALDSGWEPGLSIDRIDNYGNYSPENCRIVTMAAQNQNKRGTLMVEYNGEKMPLCVLAEKTGVNRYLVTSRVRQGWPIERALTEPVNTQYSRRHVGVPSLDP